MIKKLQKKFISITAAALFAVILLVLAAVNGIFFFQSDRQLDRRLDMLMNEYMGMTSPHSAPSETLHPGGSYFPDNGQPSSIRETENAGREENKSMGPLPRFADRLLIRADGCVICLDEAGSILEIRQDAAENYSAEDLSAVTAALLKKGRAQGWHRYFKFRITAYAGTNGSTVTVIGLINASSDLYAVLTMLLISAVIGLLSFLLVLLIIVLASGHAVKPIAESYARQKQFVTDAGHELKTPLTVISANSELARMIYGDSEWFDSIDRQVGKMNSLVRSLITLAKMDEEQEPVLAAFNLSDAVYDTAKSFEGLLHSQGKLIVFDIAENIEYTGDESRLRQVVSILMDNAVKYCDPDGKVTVKLLRDRQVKLQIINDFAAVADCRLDRLFERFYRADRARTPDGSYGLGLSIAKSIVEQHKGEIRAKALDHGRIMFEVIL
ncbi:MAG: HAMP domain-containing histidine kinase [Butyrivibrio sp.]|nr:HAMP domain-containing histidine kinase [Acetatifactor muris]MCM1558791.1 HAMP domain-containing histidine kinase [Butyrivibrio sp.]